jgi:hypothetical protein
MRVWEPERAHVTQRQVAAHKKLLTHTSDTKFTWKQPQLEKESNHAGLANFFGLGDDPQLRSTLSGKDTVAQI